MWVQVVDGWVHHPLLNILNASLELLEIRESEDVAELRLIETEAEARERRAGYEESVAAGLQSMRETADFLAERLRRAPVQSTLSGPEVDAVRGAGAEATFAQWDAIPRRGRFAAWRVRHTRDWLLEVSDELGFLAFRQQALPALTARVGPPSAAAPADPAASGA